MAGDGPDRAELEAQIARLGLGERVELAGVRPAREFSPGAAASWCPRWPESLPYVVLEAAAAGRPLIATGVGGIAEIFGPTAPNLVTPANTAALAAAMRAFLADPAAAEHEAAVRGEYIRPRFSVAHMTDDIEALYREVVAKRGRDHAGAS